MGKFGADAAALTEPRIRQYRSIIQDKARAVQLPASLVAAIISRETAGLPQYCNPPTQGGQMGDNGHGHGPMQVDDRAFPAWCFNWRMGLLTVSDGIAKGCSVLAQKRVTIGKILPQLQGIDILHAAAAAYNCGEGNVRRAIQSGQDMDALTAWHNYGSDVMQRASFFAQSGYDG